MLLLWHRGWGPFDWSAHSTRDGSAVVEILRHNLCLDRCTRGCTAWCHFAVRMGAPAGRVLSTGRVRGEPVALAAAGSSNGRTRAVTHFRSTDAPWTGRLSHRRPHTTTGSVQKNRFSTEARRSGCRRLRSLLRLVCMVGRSGMTVSLRNRPHV